MSRSTIGSRSRSPDLREHIVDADDAVRSRRAAVVHDSRVTLNPDPATLFGQETVVPGGDLTFHQHCRDKRSESAMRAIKDTD